MNTQLQENLNRIGNSQTCPVAVMFKDGKILTGHRHYTKDKWKDVSVWTIPGGRSDEGETIEETLRREVYEEVGITSFEIEDFIGQTEGAKAGDVVPIFYCTTTEEAKLMEPEKFSEWKWVTIEDYVKNEEYSGFSPIARGVIVEYLKNK